MKRLIIAAMLFLAAAAVAPAQSPTMLAMAQAELEKRGLNETEVRARLLENGIDADHIAPRDYALYQDRVMEILDKMQAEKSGRDTSAVSIKPFSPTEIPQTTKGEEEAEAAIAEALKDSLVISGNIATEDIYGHSLFAGTSLNLFRTTDGAQAPDNYVLGEGDEVHISIFGSSQTEIHQRIASDGSIHPVGVSKIFLKGMTMAQGRAAIRSKLSHHYSFREDQIAVTITTARTVSVSIYGEVGVQGGFTVSALNTAFNALAAAGGPTELGSLRNIQLFRGGKTHKMDLYTYMTAPEKVKVYDIQNGDVIFVPVAQKVVKIEGAINRAMRYELLDNETVADLIRYAGGPMANADPGFLQIERLENDEVVYLEYELRNILDGGQKVQLQNGDVVRTRVATKPIEKYVAVRGDVYYPGNYDIRRNQKLSVLLENAKPRYTARTDYLFVERTRPDETIEVLTVPFPGTEGNPDFNLEARDMVRVLEQAQYSDQDTIAVVGAVRAPFTRLFGLKDRMSVHQAIEYAGGLRPEVFPAAYIFRKDVTNPLRMEYIRVNLETEGDKLLQPGDQLRIYDNSTYANIGEVHVSGAVKEPVKTAFDKSITIHDLLSMAGGLEVGAAFDHVEVFRMNISRKDEVKFDVITLAVDEAFNVVNKPDFQLQPYDHVVVRMTPNFTMGRTVEVNGRVKYPGVYVIKDGGIQLWEVIQQAGGLLDDASPYVTLYRTYAERGPIGLNLNEVKRNRGAIQSDPILMEGDIITVARLENTVTIRETGTRMSQYVPDEYFASQKTIVYQGKHSASWYLRQYAGGFHELADRNSVTVTYPNNQSEATKKIFGLRKYPKVQPGGVITLRIDPTKREQEGKPKERVDWENILARSLSSITSVVSIILLVERL